MHHKHCLKLQAMQHCSATPAPCLRHLAYTEPSTEHHCCPAPQVHYILDEMLLNGCIIDTNKQNILEPVQLLEQVS
jgi:hypothetical protein